MALTCERLMQFDLIESLNLEKAKDWEFIKLSIDIQNVDSFIRDTPSFPGATDKIIRNELISVIGGTLSIEGSILDKEEIEESLQKAKRGEPLKRKEQEAENSRRVYEFLKEFVNLAEGRVEYSEQLIKQIHTYFTEGLNYISNVPGLYRTSFNVTFGEPRQASLCETQTDIEHAMAAFITWLNKDGTTMLSQDPFVKAIMADYYLTEIHPFGDGNGRTARALEALILYAHGINDYCFWSLSNFWSSHKDQYINHLHTIRDTLDPTEFVLWGLNGYLDEITSIKHKVLKKIKQLMFSDYIQYLFRNKKYKKIKVNQRIVTFLQLLIAWGRMPLRKVLATPEVAALYGSESTRNRDFRKMIAGELILVKRLDKEDEVFIEPNFGLLERLRYEV